LFNNIKNGNDSSCCWFYCQEIWLQLYAWKKLLVKSKNVFNLLLNYE
jgi:hypothetical protein